MVNKEIDPKWREVISILKFLGKVTLVMGIFAILYLCLIIGYILDFKM